MKLRQAHFSSKIDQLKKKIKVFFRRIGDCKRLPGNTSSLIEFLRRKQEA
jgi:hypothetical protein